MHPAKLAADGRDGSKARITAPQHSQQADPERVQCDAMCRFCCKSPKLPGAIFSAVKKSDRHDRTPAPQQNSAFRGRDASYLAPAAQIRTCGFPAYGSHLGYRRQFGAVDEPTSCVTLTRLGVRRVLSWRAFPSVPALRSTNSAADRSALFVGFPATDFSCPYIIGYGSSPSRCGPSLSRDADGQTRDLPASDTIPIFRSTSVS